MIWLRLKRYCEWLWFRAKHIAQRRDGSPQLVCIDYVGMERRGVFVNGRLVQKAPGFEVTITFGQPDAPGVAFEKRGDQ